MIMRPSLTLKTLYRSPVRTILTFILLGVVTFAFFSQTAEYAVTAREFNAAAEQYVGVGTAEIAPLEESDPAFPWQVPLNTNATNLYAPLTQEQLNAISALPYVTSADSRYMTAGFSDTYYRLDEKYFYNFTLQCIVEGTLLQYEEVYSNNTHIINRVKINDLTVLAGSLSLPSAQTQITFMTWPEKWDNFHGGGSAEAQRCQYIVSPDYIYDTTYIQNLIVGDRYVFVLRFDPLSPGSYYLGGYQTDSWCSAVWPVDGAPADYLETDDYATLKALVDITNADMHTFDMVYTSDMRAIMRFVRGDMAIIDGRLLTPEDSAEGSRVCVVSKEFAEANELGVGDTITMNLGTTLFEQYKNLGAVAGTPARYAPPVETATLEIVGVYTDIDALATQARDPHWTYSASTIFVPASLLPVDEGALAEHMFTPSEFSFKIENAWDIPAFLEESAPKIEAMGLTLIFDDDGWMAMSEGFQSAKQIALIKIAVLSAAVIAATSFIVFLFIGRKKKEYAVMRALGTPKKLAARSLQLPLMVVTVVAVLAGSVAGWIYTIQSVAANNTLSMMQEYAVSTSVPLGAVLGCVLGEILLALLIAVLLLRRIGALSPLALLQDNSKSLGRKKRAKQAGPSKKPVKSAAVPAADASSPVSKAPMETSAITDALSSVPATRKRGGARFVLRYIGRHMRRATVKSVLATALAALLFAAVGQFALIKQSYTDLCTNTVIKANIVGGLELGVLQKILYEDYVSETYYEASKSADMNRVTTSLVVTNDIARYLGEEPDVTYADGYDATVMDKFGTKIIIGESLMAQFGLALGDEVQLSTVRLFDRLKDSLVGEHRAAHPDVDLTDDEIAALLYDEILEMFNGSANDFTIVGVFSTSSGAYEDTIMTPGAYASTLYGLSAELDVAEFILSDNFRSDEFRAFLQEQAGIGLSGRLSLIMDTSELEHLLNAQRLLETLYPIAVAAALIIGGFLCCLVILQSSKEAAILRILGTTKRKTRAILSLEQIFLSVIGLIVGAGALLIYKGAGLSGILTQLLLFAGLYFAVIVTAAIVCASLATRRNVLELLQTKE